MLISAGVLGVLHRFTRPLIDRCSFVFTGFRLTLFVFRLSVLRFCAVIKDTLDALFGIANY